MLNIKKVQNFAFQNNLWTKGSRIVVGVSGGPDSVCLLNILYKLSKKYDFELHIAHVNYQLRGKDSDRDEKIVKDTAKKYGIEVSILRPNKNLYRGNLENQLRNIRYSFFEELRNNLNFDLIAVAHNQNDQAETILMRVIRGSGLNGLSAIKPKAGYVIRPLLDTNREEIIDFNKKQNIKFGIDKTNSDTKFARNKIRHELLPYLKENFNLGISKTLAQWSFAVADDHDFIALNAERFVSSICKIKRDKTVLFSAKEFLKEHPAIQRQALMIIFEKLSGNLSDLESRQIDEVIKVIKSEKNKIQRANIYGLNILKKNDNIDIFC